MMQRIAEDLFPPIEPYHADYLPVGDGHKLYYEMCGNPDGIPILCLHGGPGVGCNEDMRRFFDPDTCCIMLFDQRGSGRSRPWGRMEANTTWHLVEDINKLLTACKKEKTVLMGGSWGSTLALVYAIAYPEKILGMVLRGIFLSEHSECIDYLNGQREHSRFPELCERFLQNVPEAARNNPADFYDTMITSGNMGTRMAYAYEWVWYESARAKLIPISDVDLKRQIAAQPFLQRVMTELHYIRKNCFLEDGYIMNNIHRIPRVPISIIHGRYDDLCPVENAIRLHKALPASKLHIVTAGHAGTDPEIQKKVISETDAMVSVLKQENYPQ